MKKEHIKRTKLYIYIREFWKTITLKRTSFIKFLYTQRVVGFTPSEVPTFDSEKTVDFFNTLLSQSKNYLEFGAGGSTFQAAKLGIPFTSIDSDRFYLNAVKTLITRKIGPLKQNQLLVHRYIGPTKQWGRPILSCGMSQKFKKYSDLPLDPKTQKSINPDLVLVDGRFRVACTLKAIDALKGCDSWTILVDDYIDRPQYHVIEHVAKINKMVGRMAVICSTIKENEHLLARLIKEYELNPD